MSIGGEPYEYRENTMIMQNEFRLHTAGILAELLMQEFAILITTTPFPDGAYLYSLTTSFFAIYSTKTKKWYRPFRVELEWFVWCIGLYPILIDVATSQLKPAVADLQSDFKAHYFHCDL